MYFFFNDLHICTNQLDIKENLHFNAYMNGYQTTIEIQQSVNLPNLFYVEKDRVLPQAAPESVSSLKKYPTLMSRYRSFIENKMNKKTEIFRLMNQIGKRKNPKRIRADLLDKRPAAQLERPVTNTFHTKDQNRSDPLHQDDLHIAAHRDEFEADEGIPINPSSKRESATQKNSRMEDSAIKHHDRNLISEQDASKPQAPEQDSQKAEEKAKNTTDMLKKPAAEKKIGCSPCNLI